MKKVFEYKADKILLALFLSTMAAYVAISATAFSHLPPDVGPFHEFLFLYFHFIPMFFLQLLLCRLARPLWRVLIPALLLAAPALVFVAAAKVHVIALILAGWWCAAPAVGCALAWLVWGLGRKTAGRPKAA